MTFKQDIQEKIIADFKDSADLASAILIDAILKTDYLKTDRVIRCIIFLSDGDLNKMRRFINVAINDTRDVMLRAEYVNLKIGEKPKRVRDFNKTFDNCENDVKE
jgi:hypothetical protein